MCLSIIDRQGKARILFFYIFWLCGCIIRTECPHRIPSIISFRSIIYFVSETESECGDAERGVCKQGNTNKEEGKREGKGRRKGHVRCGEWCGVVCVVPVWVCVCVDVWMWYGSMACQIKRKEFVSISYYSRAGQDRVDGINV